MIFGAQEIVVATGNKGKLRELAGILEDLDVALLPQSEFDIEPAVEDGESFVENALIKARHAASVTGLPAIADDSGLVVEALGGRPGIHSARFAGDDASDRQNIDKLLAEMKDLTGDQRQAAFHCAAVLVGAGFPDIVVEGRWAGSILHAPDGNGGFGYDPVFFVADAGSSAASLPAAEKNLRSHRGQAFRRLKEKIRNQQADED